MDGWLVNGEGSKIVKGGGGVGGMGGTAAE